MDPNEALKRCRPTGERMDPESLVAFLEGLKGKSEVQANCPPAHFGDYGQCIEGCDDALRDTLQDAIEAAHAQQERLEHFEALDAWLVRGGFLPADWQKGR